MQRLMRRTWARYTLSYMAVLLIPLLIISLLINNRFLARYREDVLSQLMGSMARVHEEFDTLSTQLFSVTSQIALAPEFRTQRLQSDPAAYASIEKILRNYRNTNVALRDVTYFNAQAPERFYTTFGTYMPAYYKQYLADDGQVVTADVFYRSRKHSGYIPYQRSVAGTIPFARCVELLHRVPNIPDAYLIYSLSEAAIAERVRRSEHEVEQAVLISPYGEQIYPLTPLPDALQTELNLALSAGSDGAQRISGDRYLLQRTSDITGFTCLYVVSERALFGEVTNMRNALMLSVLLLSLVGGVAVYLISLWHARPIQALARTVEGIVSPLPQGSELASIRSAVALMSAQNEALRQQAESLRVQADAGHEEPAPAHAEPPRSEEPSAPPEPDESAPQWPQNGDPMRDVIDFVNEHQGDMRLNVGFVADAFGLSISNLSHQFKNSVGHTLSDYITARRVYEATRLLKETQLTVAEIAARLGYSQPSSFIRMFRRVEDMTPLQYRAQYAANAKDAMPPIES